MNRIENELLLISNYLTLHEYYLLYFAFQSTLAFVPTINSIYYFQSIYGDWPYDPIRAVDAKDWLYQKSLEKYSAVDYSMYMKLNRVVNDWDYTALQLAHLRQYKELERIDWNLVSRKTKSNILQTKLGDEASLIVLQSLDLAQLENRDFVFLRSCFLGYYLSAKYLLQSPLVDPTYARNRAITAAAYNGYLDMLELLLNDSRVDPAVSNNCPIRMAAKNGHLDIVKLLLKDPRVDPSADNQFAVRYASLNKHFKVVKVLLEDPRVQDYGSDNFYSIPGIVNLSIN